MKLQVRIAVVAVVAGADAAMATAFSAS